MIDKIYLIFLAFLKNSAHMTVETGKSGSHGQARGLETPAGIDIAVSGQNFFPKKPSFLSIRPSTDYIRPTCYGG